MTQPGAPPRRQPGDWDCPACNNVNWARRARYNKCGTPHPRGATAARQFGREPGGVNAVVEQRGSPGTQIQWKGNFGGGPGDWECLACGNINWRRREACNACGTQTSASRSEARVGRGGGHFERTPVEYKDAPAEDEYAIRRKAREEKARKRSIEADEAADEDSNAVIVANERPLKKKFSGRRDL
eukprot:TRINITY_DN602_c0_g1_i1.p1 TRINITY_DN602_c0_g1~~TRINITY_DN602_c0_g1_i1.p1  ORF type:complete len:185 (+),score=29.52 TRINITY_DN602_c0_g1_i1:73-627(+)